MAENFTLNDELAGARFLDFDKIEQSFFMELFNKLNWNPKLNELENQYVIELTVPVNDASKTINSNEKYSVFFASKNNTPYCTMIISFPVPVHTKAFVDSAVPLVEKIAKRFFDSEDDYTIQPDYTNGNMGINFMCTILGLPNDGDTDVFAWKDEVVKTIQYETLMLHYYIHFLNEEGERRVKEQKSSTEIRSSESGGCYIATCVYGSYDCPQVWTLRRYRDNTLAKSWYGKAFIRTYYAISPTLVKWFGHTNWFKKLWVGTLNKTVESLQANGVESTPYEDTPW